MDITPTLVNSGILGRMNQLILVPIYVCSKDVLQLLHVTSGARKTQSSQISTSVFVIQEYLTRLSMIQKSVALNINVAVQINNKSFIEM